MRLKTIIKNTLVLFALILFFLSAIVYSNLKDRHPDYNVDISVTSKTSRPLQVGFAATRITPQFFETWNDIDNNARYEPDKRDTFNDLNDNRTFDALWITGFSNNVAANGINDDIWARTMIIDDGETRLAIVSLDVIGIFHSMVIDIRKMLPEDLNITYLTIASTHTHEAPDLLGLWGEADWKSGVNEEWKEYVKKQTITSITDAVKSLRPAHLHFSQNLEDGMVTLQDTREPYVLDHGLRMIQATDAENGTTLGSLIQWSNHPETVWSRNLMISSDFPHYLRKAIEDGVYNDSELVEEGIGGISVYVNGAVGGLMTTHASLGVKDPFSDTVYIEPSFEKVRAQADTLGLIILKAMKENPLTVKESSINLRAKTFNLPVDNHLFILASALNVIDMGLNGWKTKKTEAAAWSIGPATFITFPGELYPEILNGGIEALPNRDYEIEPQETPPLREKMKGEFKFAIGLANDEIGYIIPKSQWDEKAPFVYGEKAYGESNSMGPNTAPLLHKELCSILDELNQ